MKFYTYDTQCGGIDQCCLPHSHISPQKNKFQLVFFFNLWIFSSHYYYSYTRWVHAVFLHSFCFLLSEWAPNQQSTTTDPPTNLSLTCSCLSLKINRRFKAFWKSFEWERERKNLLNYSSFCRSILADTSKCGFSSCVFFCRLLRA